MPKKKTKRINYTILIEMLGDLGAPYDSYQVLEKIEKLISLIEIEESLDEDVKPMVISKIVKEMNEKAVRLMNILDYETVAFFPL
jgi:hypothetical protein